MSIDRKTTPDDNAMARAASAGGPAKSAYVQRIFSQIAPRYDLLNHLLSLNIDRGWRRRAIGELGASRNASGVYLDACAGTLDVGLELSRSAGFSGEVVAADFAEPMLRAGLKKRPPRSLAPVVADVLVLPLADRTIAGAIVAFGIRNVDDLDTALAEVLRVLEAGGRFVILEFSTPRIPIVRALYHFYFRHVLPLIGGVVSGHGTAYRYLPRSVAHFPGEEELAVRMVRTGFVNVQWSSLTFGIAAIHTGEKAG